MNLVDFLGTRPKPHLELTALHLFAQSSPPIVAVQRVVMFVARSHHRGKADSCTVTGRIVEDAVSAGNEPTGEPFFWDTVR